jgi:hypothetical protein
MAHFRYGEWTEQEKPIYKSTSTIGSTKGVQILAANVGLNKDGKKTVPAGLFMAKVGGVNRFLPRAKTEAAVTTGSPNIEVAYPELFLAGDEIYHIEPKTAITLAATWAAGDTLEIAYGSVAYRATATATPTILDEYISEFAELFNASPLSKHLRFEADLANDKIVVYTHGTKYTVRVTATTAGNGTATLDAQVSSAPTYLGKVSRVDHAAKTVVLEANSAAAVGEGGRIGTMIEEMYGLHASNVDFKYRDRADLNAVTEARAIYKISLPYYDEEIDEQFEKLTIE